MSAPSMARDHLHVIGSSCRFAGVMPAPKPHSDRPCFDRRDRSSHGCRLTTDAAHLLVGAAAVTFSLRYVRASCLPPLRSCPGHVSSRSEAPWHASADAHSCCVPAAAVRTSLTPRVAESRVPRPTASIGPSSLRRAGQFGCADGLRGRQARRFDDHAMVYARRRARQRRFSACPEDAQRVPQRRKYGYPGQWRSHLCPGCGS